MIDWISARAGTRRDRKRYFANPFPFLPSQSGRIPFAALVVLEVFSGSAERARVSCMTAAVFEWLGGRWYIARDRLWDGRWRSDWTKKQGIENRSTMSSRRLTAWHSFVTSQVLLCWQGNRGGCFPSDMPEEWSLSRSAMRLDCLRKNRSVRPLLSNKDSRDDHLI